LGTTLEKGFLTVTVTAVPVVGGDGVEFIDTVASFIFGDDITVEVTIAGSHGLVTTALLAPSLAAFVALFFRKRYRPNSMTPKTRIKSNGRIIANSTNA
jgi:hypothetical protein